MGPMSLEWPLAQPPVQPEHSLSQEDANSDRPGNAHLGLYINVDSLRCSMTLLEVHCPLRHAGILCAPLLDSLTNHMLENVNASLRTSSMFRIHLGSSCCFEHGRGTSTSFVFVAASIFDHSSACDVQRCGFVSLGFLVPNVRTMSLASF